MHHATPPALQCARRLSWRRAAYGAERSVGRLVIVARGQGVTRLEARVRNPSRPVSNPSLAHKRGRRACTWRRHLPYSVCNVPPASGILWWRAQRQPPRDCREIRVTGLEARVRNPSRPVSNPSLAHKRGRRVCTWRRHLPYSVCAIRHTGCRRYVQARGYRGERLKRARRPQKRARSHFGAAWRQNGHSGCATQQRRPCRLRSPPPFTRAAGDMHRRGGIEGSA